jgi:hypothetical protein
MTSDVTPSPVPESVESLTNVVYQAVGAASTCWESLSDTGVFQEDRARAVAEDLLEKIHVFTRYDTPSLGLATNAELREELRVREEMGFTDDDYRTLEPSHAMWRVVTEEWVGKELLWQHRDHPNIYSTDRGKTWYNLNEPVKFDGNPTIYGNTEDASA